MRARDWAGLVRCREARAERALGELGAQRGAVAAAHQGYRMTEAAYWAAQERRAQDLRDRYQATLGTRFTAADLAALDFAANGAAREDDEQWGQVAARRIELARQVERLGIVHADYDVHRRAADRTVELRREAQAKDARSAAMLEELELEETAGLRRAGSR